MQTINFTKTNVINPYASEEAAQRALVENLGSRQESRFDRLPAEVKNQLEQWFIFSANERELVARIDRHFEGNEVIELGRDKKTTFSWKGYSKIADIAVDEYRKRRMAHH